MYTLLDKVGGGTDDVHQTFVVNLAGEPADGTWQLRVQDTVAGDTGTLTGWTLTHNLYVPSAEGESRYVGWKSDQSRVQRVL